MTTKEKTEDRLKREFDYFLEHHNELQKDCNGKHLVIKGEKVVDIHDSEKEAYFKSLERHEPETFFVHLCTPGDEAYSGVLHSARGVRLRGMDSEIYVHDFAHDFVHDFWYSIERHVIVEVS